MAVLRDAWRSILCSFAMLGCLAPIVAADGAEVTHLVSGTWQSSDFHDPANPGCSVGSNGSEHGGRLIMGASQRNASPMNLVVRKSGWAIPNGTTVQVHASFPDGVTLDLAGAGSGEVITIDMPPAKLPSWVHELTASSAMRLSFAGNEPPWTFDLGGTSAVITAMYHCFADHGITGVDAPFSPTAGAQSAATTQPFGNAAPLPPAPPAPTDLRAPTSLPDPPVVAPVQKSEPREHGDVVLPAASAPAPAAAQATIPGQGGCIDDWHRCSDNSDLVNHWNGYVDVHSKCEDAANHEAKYGDPKWPGFWSGGSFARFHAGNDYLTEGVAVAVEPDVQFQNAFGAMVHSTAICRFNLNSMTVESVDVQPN